MELKKEVFTSFRYKGGVYLTKNEFQLILHGLVLFRDELLEGDLSNQNTKNHHDVQRLLDEWSFLIEDFDKAIKNDIKKESEKMPPVGEHDSQSQPPTEELLRTGDQCKSTTGNCE
tara:strand:- start:412 stop:759 length:348 start_codon:yes stop_codon:yes gene_type:complete